MTELRGCKCGKGSGQTSLKRLSVAMMLLRLKSLAMQLVPLPRKLGVPFTVMLILIVLTRVTLPSVLLTLHMALRLGFRVLSIVPTLVCPAYLCGETLAILSLSLPR